jgi:cytochrome P450
VTRTYTKEHLDWVESVERSYDGGGHVVYYMDEVRHYKTTTHTYRGKVSNPAYDPEVSDRHHGWLQIHKIIYRDGLHHRQRRHAIRKDKRAFHHRQRAREKQAIRNLVDEILEHGYQDLLGHGVGSYNVTAGAWGW